jgi:hypothetical protein
LSEWQFHAMNDEEGEGWELQWELVKGSNPTVEATVARTSAGVEDEEDGDEVGEDEGEKAAAAGERLQLLTGFLEGELLVIAAQAEEGEVVLVGLQTERTAEIKAPLLLLLLMVHHSAVVCRSSAP